MPASSLFRAARVALELPGGWPVAGSKRPAVQSSHGRSSTNTGSWRSVDVIRSNAAGTAGPSNNPKPGTSATSAGLAPRLTASAACTVMPPSRSVVTETASAIRSRVSASSCPVFSAPLECTARPGPTRPRGVRRCLTPNVSLGPGWHRLRERRRCKTPIQNKKIGTCRAQSRSTSLDIQRWRGLARAPHGRPTELSTVSVDRMPARVSVPAGAN